MKRRSNPIDLRAEKCSTDDRVSALGSGAYVVDGGEHDFFVSAGCVESGVSYGGMDEPPACPTEHLVASVGRSASQFLVL